MRTVVYMGLELYYIMRDFLWELWLILLLITLSPKAEELKVLEPMTRAVLKRYSNRRVKSENIDLDARIATTALNPSDED